MYAIFRPSYSKYITGISYPWYCKKNSNPMLLNVFDISVRYEQFFSELPEDHEDLTKDPDDLFVLRQTGDFQNKV